MPVSPKPPVVSRLPRRRREHYFPRLPKVPPPIEVRVNRRVSFSDADPMGILWHGRYAHCFEQSNETLGRACGMSYEDFIQAKLLAPIVQFHVDYFSPVRLGEEVTTTARLVWNEGARLNIEYEVRHARGSLAATGYTVQMLTTVEGEPILVSPPLLEKCRKRWLAGEFHDGEGWRSPPEGAGQQA